MQNMEIFFYPKELHYTSQIPMNIRLIYKKICITTNHQLQKIQNRQSYPIKNSIAQINTEIKFTLSKQFQLNNTKIVIIIIGLKGRQIQCLGDISLDLTSLRQKKSIQGFHKAKLDKSKDAKAYLSFDIKFSQKSIQPILAKKHKKQPIPELGIIKTQHYYKEQLYISRRQKQDKPTAYQISRKNFKNNQIRRNPDNKSQQKKYTSSSKGSYKKRFQYDVNRLDKSRKKSNNKQIGSNYLKVYQKDKSPSPRIKTPQPITIESLKTGQGKRIFKQTSTIDHLDISSVQKIRKYDLDQSDQMLEPQTFRAKHYLDSSVSQYRSQKQSKVNYQSKTMNELAQNYISVNSSINNQKDSKYKTITQKLEMIESKIRKQKQKYDQKDKYSPIIKNQIQQIQAYEITQNNSNPHEKFGSSYNLEDSTCPRNQKPPSPIQIAETPDANKTNQTQIKMSQFTINSRKNDEQNNENRIPVLEVNNFNSQKSKFQKIEQKQIKKEKSIYKNTISSQNKQSPNRQKRQISPSNFQQRKKQLQFERKSSLGTNYLETQVKMLELQIQTKKNQFQKLQKNFIKVQNDCSKLQQQNYQYKQKLNLKQNQIQICKQRQIQLTQRISLLQKQKNQLLNSIRIQATCFAQELNGNINQSNKNDIQVLVQKIQLKQQELKRYLKNLNDKSKQIQFLTQKVQNLKNYENNFLQNLDELNNEKKQRQIQKKTLMNTLNKQTEKIIILQKKISQLQIKNQQITKNSQKLINQQYTIKIDKKENFDVDLNLKKYIKDIKNLQQKVIQLQNTLQKKQKIIQKLSNVNQNFNEKIYLQNQQNNTKINQLDQQIQDLLMKNMQAQTTIKQLKQELKKKQKQLKQLQNMELRNTSKSQSIVKVKTQNQNFEQKYENQRKKCNNLQSQLKFSQNKIRTLNLQLQNLKLEKKDLEQQIDMISRNNGNQLAKKSALKKVNLENPSITEAINLQNKVLKEQIKILQNQVKQLNYLLDGAIQKANAFEIPKSIYNQSVKNPEFEKNVFNQKYIALSRRLQTYENQLRTKKNKMAQIINCVWRGNDASLIDQIDRIMGLQ